MRLFKFVSSTHAVLNMARGSLKFTPLPELNDPSELTPVMNRAAVRKSLEELRLHGLTKEQYRWLGCQDAVLRLLAPQEKVIDAPRTLEEANRMLSISVYDNLDYMERKLFRPSSSSARKSASCRSPNAAILCRCGHITRIRRRDS